MSRRPVNRQWLLPVCVAALFLTALLWARARDPFRRIHFSLVANGTKTEAVAVLPAEGGDFPVVVFAHGSAEDLMRDNNALRLMAEQGLAAVSLDYDKTNQANFDAQMEALLRWLPTRSWAMSNSVAWITQSLGAQRTLSFLVRHPEFRPQVLIRLNGGWIEEAERQPEAESYKTDAGRSKADRSTLNHQLSTNLTVWLVHGDQDEAFPVADCRRVEEWFQTKGASVRVTVFPNRPHSFGENQPLLIRTAAEFCMEQMGGAQPVQVNVRPTLWPYWLPALAICLGGTVVGFRARAAEWIRQGNRALRYLAFGLAALAVLDSAVHLFLPQLRASPLRLKWARAWLVQSELRSDFDWLAQQPGMADQRIRTLLQHLELGDLQRRFFQPEPSRDHFRTFVLSPRIESDDEEIGWRRVLWESFYPRIRHESDPEAAAEIVVRFLRERVTISRKAAPQRSIPKIWSSGLTDPEGFERIYVAALRSVGVAARLDEKGAAELWANGRWLAAPRPLFEQIP